MTRLLNGLFIGSLLAVTPLAAQQRLDDSLSPRQQVRANIEWAPSLQVLARGVLPDEIKLRGVIQNLDIRLDTSAFVGQQARITMKIPLPVQGLANPAGMRVEWTTGGVFQAGEIVPGTEALVFQGLIKDDVLRDVINMQILLEPRAINGNVQFEPVFEIELL